MAAFKKKLPMSAALRQGGFGTVPPEKPKAGGGGGGGNPFGMSQLKGPKAPAAPKAPTKIGVGVKMPGMPKMPKIK